MKINPKILIVVAIGTLVVAFFLSTRIGGKQDALSEAVEAGELTLTSMGRSHESLTQFLQENEAQAMELLEAARVALENAMAKLNSAAPTNDEYVLGMIDNYQKTAQASDVMARGIDNLLVVSENLTNALNYYSQKNYAKASEQALNCLHILTPLLSEFETSNATLKEINVLFVPSGQRDRLTLRVGQYRNEMETYSQYVRLLESLLRGKEYLERNDELEEKLRELQNAVANKYYEKAETLRQEISKILQSLRDPKYQTAVDSVSKLDPNLLGGTASEVAQELRDKLRDLEAIGSFENYLQSLEKYLEALRHFELGELPEAEQAANEALGILGQGQGGDPELQGLVEGLREALNSLQLHIKGRPPPG